MEPRPAELGGKVAKRRMQSPLRLRSLAQESKLLYLLWRSQFQATSSPFSSSHLDPRELEHHDPASIKARDVDLIAVRKDATYSTVHLEAYTLQDVA